MVVESVGQSTVMLPGGLADSGERCLRRVSLRPLTGREEDWLADAAGLPSAPKVTRLLSQCVVSLEDSPVSVGVIRKLLVGDRDFLMLRLRAVTLGDRVQAVIPCPACNERMDVEFIVSGVPVEVRPQNTLLHSVELNGRALRLRLPNGGDQEAVIGLDLRHAANELLHRCLVDDGGLPMQAGERDAIAAAMERLAPSVDLELDLSCPECGHAFLAPFDTTAFFLEEMQSNRDRLLREFHTLAFYYHWSERDILRMRRDRRRAYLAMLSEALRQD